MALNEKEIQTVLISPVITKRFFFISNYIKNPSARQVIHEDGWG